MTNDKRSVTIVGGGQSGLQLALGLLKAGGYDVRVVQNRTGDEIAKGRVTSSQCMFDNALQNERDIDANFWEDAVPDGRFHQFHRAGPRRLRRKGDRLERQARPLRPERRPAGQVPRLDEGGGGARRNARHP